MIYALVKNNQIERINISLPTVIDGTTIPAGATGLEQFNLWPITGSEPAYDPATQRLSGPSYAVTSTAVERVWVIEELTAEEIRARDVPQSVSMRQAELALLQADLLEDIETLVATLPKIDQITWNRATTVERNNPLVKYIQVTKGLTDLQIDALFVLASTL